jgi:hypothetical protein
MMLGGGATATALEDSSESKSDSLERFPGSGVTHLPAEGQIDCMGRKTGLALILAAKVQDGPPPYAETAS